jgi:hypothetical protein
MNSEGFPVLPAGEYALVLFLRKADEDWEEKPIARYPIYVERPS